MSEAIDFQPYLRAIRQNYARWWEVYTVTDVRGREWQNVRANEELENPASPFDFGLFDFGLKVQTVTREEGQPKQREKPRETIEQLPVLAGLRKYAFDEKTRHLLLVGRPGSGKSTALARLLLEESRQPSGTIPVLVELRYWQTTIEALMLDFFRRHELNLSHAELENLLGANQLLVLMDGTNELPSEEARSQLAAFRRQYPRVPAIFTTRDLSLGGDFGIEKKLEMQPLTEPQMQSFVRAYLPERGEALLQQLQGRLREFGQTPLLLWMLCEVVCQSPDARLPNNLGGIFQVFARSYELSSVRKHEVAALKGDTKPLSDRRLWGKALEHLAWVMMGGEKPVELRVAIRRQEAERELEKLFEKEPSPPKTTRDCLDDLLKYHLLQIKTGNEIEFRHQLIQEYYAAEALLGRLPQLGDGELKQEYLNYLKWTEPVALMLALVADEVQVVRVVRLALEVDWMLGARLAGEVKWEFQEKAVGMVSGLDVPQWLKVELWEETRSDFAVPGLLRVLEDENSSVRESAVWALEELVSEMAIPGLLQALEHEDSEVRRIATEALEELSSEVAIPGLLQALEDENSSVRGIAAEALGRLGSEAAIPGLLQALEHEDFEVRENAAWALGKLGSEVAIPGLLQALEDEDSEVRENAAGALGALGSEVAIPGLLQALEDEEYSVRRSAAWVLGALGSEVAIPGLLQALEDDSSSVRESAAWVLGELGSEAAIPGLLRALEDENSFVRASAAGALGKLGSEAAIPGLLRALENDSSSVRESAAEVLGKLGSQVAIPGLLRALEDENSSVRRTATEALGKLGSQKAIAGLLRALEDEDYQMRRSAARILRNIKDDRAAYILPRLLTLIPTESGKDAFDALTAIQANCKFYNYDIFHSPPVQEPSPHGSPSSPVYHINNPETVTIVEQNRGEVIAKQISKAE